LRHAVGVGKFPVSPDEEMQSIWKVGLGDWRWIGCALLDFRPRIGKTIQSLCSEEKAVKSTLLQKGPPLHLSPPWKKHYTALAEQFDVAWSLYLYLVKRSMFTIDSGLETAGGRTYHTHGISSRRGRLDRTSTSWLQTAND
jgi:hypothetical protein